MTADPPSDADAAAVIDAVDPKDAAVDPAADDPKLAVFVVEDDPAVRESLAAILDEMAEDLYSYPTAEQFLLSYLQRMETHDQPLPGLLVLDVRMQGMSGLELHREILRRNLPLAVLIHTGHGNVAMSVEAMRQGAVDVLEKPCEPQMLRNRVRDGLAQARDIWEARVRNCKIVTREASLTARESEVYHLLLEGLETKQIGHRLGISPSTVEKHRLKVFDKMGVDTVPRLIRYVLDNTNEQR